MAPARLSTWFPEPERKIERFSQDDKLVTQTWMQSRLFSALLAMDADLVGGRSCRVTVSPRRAWSARKASQILRVY